MDAIIETSNPFLKPYSFEHLLMGGIWRSGSAAVKVRDFNPFSGAILAEFSGADVDDVSETFSAAAKARVGWSAATPSQRSEVLRRAADILDARHGEIVTWIIHETGSARYKAEAEWAAVRAILLEASTLPTRVFGRIIPGDIPGKEHRIYRKPVGVVSIISPWNWPFHLTSRVAAPALALGNAVVVKPASETPIVGGLLLGRVLEEAGLPPGLFSVVFGDVREIGDPFVLNPFSRVISFTGSTRVGRRVGELAAKGPTLKRAMLELGGNNPLVVLDDADLDQAVSAAVAGRFLHQGELCVSTNRIIVEDGVHDAFVDEFANRVSKLKFGDPNEADTIIGPIISQRQLDGLLIMIEEAKSDGARLRVGQASQGLVLPPHVFDSIAPSVRLGRSEIFGPIAPLIRARDEEEALRMANDTEFGLSSAVFTRDLARGERFAHKVEAGMTHINDMTAVDLANMPFGGEKDSGMGRFGAEGLIQDLTTEHWISVQHSSRVYPF